MFWAAAILISLAVLFFLYRFKRPGSKKSDSSSPADRDVQAGNSIDKEAQLIVEKIINEKQIDKLEEQRDKAQEKIFRAKTDRAEASAERKCEILDRAIDIAYNKTLFYQFLPDIGLNIPSHKLEAAFKVFSINDIEEAKSHLGNSESEWVELTYGDEPEEKQPEVVELKKFREIVESDLPNSKKSVKINRLVKKSKYLIENYFDDDDEFSAWDQWKIHVLEALGVPAAPDLYRAGYTTFIDCLNIDPAELIEIDGIGSKTQETFIKFQAESKNQSHSQ